MVKASDGVNSDDVDFTILISASLTPATSQASPGYVDIKLTIGGTGFKPNGTVTIKYDDTQKATATADSTGVFSVTFNAPVSIGGNHTIIATDDTNTEQFTFVMESAPPSTVYPLLPLMGGKLEGWKFDWCGSATDPSIEVTDDSLPITYTLEIATDADFTNIVLKKEGLSTSEYTITTKEEKQLLPSTKKEAPYYWHVKAIDSASNETEWTGAGIFYVGFTFEMPPWALYVLFGVGALLLFFLGFQLGRRTAYSSW